MARIFLRQYFLSRRNTPVYSKVRVIERNGAFRPRCIEIVTFILKNSRFTEHCETMRKTTWDKKLSVVFLSQLNCNMLAECRTSLANINSHIENCTFDTSYKFAVRIWHLLIVQATHHSI